jgi:hypothetical protein
MEFQILSTTVPFVSENLYPIDIFDLNNLVGAHEAVRREREKHKVYNFFTISTYAASCCKLVAHR